MTVSATPFTIEAHGTHTPCHLLYVLGEKHSEIVRFEKGLSGSARFTGNFTSYIKVFQHFGILIPPDPHASAELQTKAGRFVALSDSGFGEAFYRYYFPKMQKHSPERYHWETL
jgi:hypothetical protein